MIHNITGRTDNFQHVFFDLDGTITDSAPGIKNSLQYMFEKIGIEEKDEARLNAFLGPPVTQQLCSAYGFSQQQAKEAYVFYREYYERAGMFENRLYDGIGEAIEDIRRSGKEVYVATAKPEPDAIMILKRFGVFPLFNRVFAVKRDIGIYDKTQVLQYASENAGRYSRASDGGGPLL